MMDKFILVEGEPLACSDLMSWAKWYENFENRRIDETTVRGTRISTVFLGIDHGFGWYDEDGPLEDYKPVLFETMIFGGVFDEEMWRYTSQAAAKAGHLEACILVWKWDHWFLKWWFQYVKPFYLDHVKPYVDFF